MGTYNELLLSSSLFCRLLDDIHQREREQEESSPLAPEPAEEEEEEEEIRVDSPPSNSTINAASAVKGEEALSRSSTVETKAKGRLKWQVYLSYLRAGAGLVLGLVLVTVVSGVQQGAYIFGNWWLAQWNDEESFRHRIFANCSLDEQNNTIWTMTDQQWNEYRNRRFYIYSGLSSSRRSRTLWRRWSLVGLVLIFIVIALFRTVIIELMFVNAARVLHNK